MSTDEATAPRRLRAQDVIEGYKEIIEQLTQRGTEPYVTVEHTLNAKGDTQTSVKVSAPMGHDVDELQTYAISVECVAARVYEQAKGRYPRTNGETK